MSVLRKLHPASYAGVKFLMYANRTSGGRKQANYEYIGTGRRESQDLGLYPRVFKVRGMLQNNQAIGQDYFRNRDNFLRALESPNSNTLIHPFYGELKVTTGIYSLDETIKELGFGRISFTATVVDKSIFSTPLPTAGDTVGDQTVADKADQVNNNVASGNSGNFSISKVFKNSYTSSSNVFTNSLSEIQGSVSPFATDLNSLAQFTSSVENNIELVNALLANPLSLFNTLVGTVTGAGGLVTNAIDAIAGFKRFNQFGESIRDFGGTTPTADQQNFSIENLSPNILVRPAPLTTQDQEIKSNTTLLTNTVRQTSLAEQYRNAVTIDYESVTDIDAQQQSLEDQFNILKDDLPDDAYESFNELRSLADQVFKEKRLTTAVIREITLQSAQPLSVLAYYLYQDSSRDDEIQDLNNLSDPIFVIGDIEVLTDVDPSS